MENEWLKMNQKKINGLKYRLEELSYKNEIQQVPIREVVGLLNAAIVEVKKLTNKVEDLTNQLIKEKAKEAE